MKFRKLWNWCCKEKYWRNIMNTVWKAETLHYWFSMSAFVHDYNWNLPPLKPVMITSLESCCKFLTCLFYVLFYPHRSDTDCTLLVIHGKDEKACKFPDMHESIVIG